MAHRKITTLNKKYTLIFLHILGWALVLVLPIVLGLPKAIRFEKLSESIHDMQNFLSWMLLIGFAYLNHFWFVPQYYLNKKHLVYSGIVVVCLISMFALPECTHLFMDLYPPPDFGPSDIGGFPPGPPPDMKNMPRFFEDIRENSHFVLLFFLSVLVSISYNTQIQLRETQKQSLQTELDNLKSQIQPHFLFNTLNSIYSLVIRKDDKAADTVVQLSEFLRYVIENTWKNEVGLEKEITYLTNYIDLQKSRLRDSIDLFFEIEGDPEGLKIAPLILFSFIENAFQYGVNPEEESIIKIRIEIIAENLMFYVFNKKVNTQNRGGTGIGLENTVKRLNLIYPNRHKLEKTETDLDYTIQLTIQLNG